MSIASISLDNQLLPDAVEINIETHHYEILSSEELEEKIKSLEESDNEEENE